MRKSSSYRETFRRHRRLLIAPIIVSTLIGGWFVLGAPKSYQSTTSLWVDSPASVDSSLANGNPALTPPSQQEQNVVNELLATRGFVLQVGHNSMLAHYLASNPSSGFGPTALLSSFGGGGSLDDQIIGKLNAKSVTTAMPGPQVLQISFSGPTPAVAQSTLSTLVNVLQADSARYSQAHSQAATTYYKTQVSAANQAVAAAHNQLAQYRRLHPKAPASDPNLNTLDAAVTAASTQLTQANANLSGASSGAAGSVSSVRVIDAAALPAGAASGKKKDLMGVVGGLIAGLLISFLGTVALTRRESDPWEDELAAGQRSGALDRTTAGVAPTPVGVRTASGGSTPAGATESGHPGNGDHGTAGNGTGNGSPGNGTSHLRSGRLFVSGRQGVQGSPDAEES